MVLLAPFLPLTAILVEDYHPAIGSSSMPLDFELASAISEYIEGFHNRRRRHSALAWSSPKEFETNTFKQPRSRRCASADVAESRLGRRLLQRHVKTSFGDQLASHVQAARRAIVCPAG